MEKQMLGKKENIIFSRQHERGENHKENGIWAGDVCSTVNGIWAEGGSQVGAHAAVFHGVVVWTHVRRALVSQLALDR